MATELDLELGPEVVALLDEFGFPAILREPLGSYDPAVGRVVSFWGTDISASAADNSLNRPSGDWADEGIEEGGFIFLSGFISPYLAGWKQIESVAALKLTLAAGDFATEAAGRKVGIQRAADHEVQAVFEHAEVVREDPSLPSDSKGAPMAKAREKVYFSRNALAPKPQSWLFFAGPADSATPYVVTQYKAIYTGAEAPLGYLEVVR
jgi:hypothetical protein